MSINITFAKNKVSKSSSNLILFSNDKYNIKDFKKFLSNHEYSYINDLLKSNDLKQNILVFKIK